MLIIGDLSGIQDYLFDLPDMIGAQSRRLRARSFYLQTIAETAALRLMKAAGWSADHRVFSAAGKFLLQGDSFSAQQQQSVEAEACFLSRWLLKRTGARIRLSIAYADDTIHTLAGYQTAMNELQRIKSRPLALDVIQDGQWNLPELASISPPCEACSRLKAVKDYPSHERVYRVCHACYSDLKIGSRLPDANWLELREYDAQAEDDLFSLELHLHTHCPTDRRQTYALFDLNAQEPERFSDPPQVHRRLGRHTPDGDFDLLAPQATGAPYLGVLKMDADSLGMAVNKILDDAHDFTPLREFSQKLDLFFAKTLQEQMKQPEWSNLYTVFSGGDDLLLVGPWNVAFRFAHLVQKEFKATFHQYNLTISGGLAIIPRKHPIRRAVESADALLEEAKHAGRNRFATFGQVWEWKAHEGILLAANNLIEWVEDNTAERGWLHTLMHMTEHRNDEPLTVARLVYHVDRNYPRTNDNNPQKRALLKWIDQRVGEFDNPATIETLYLSAILRYALMATRNGDDL